MENISLSIILPLATLPIVWLGLLYGRLRGWVSLGEQVQSEARLEKSAPAPWHEHIWHQIWNRLLALIALLVVLYFMLFAPPRLGGQISIVPNELGRPFYHLHWQQEYIHQNPDHIGWLIGLGGSVFSLLVLGFGLLQRRREKTQPALLIVALTLAAMGQWLLGQDMLMVGAVYYGVAGIGILGWMMLARKHLRSDLDIRLTWLPENEVWLLLAIVALAAFARLYALSNVPYGVEGDESKWIFEVVEMMIDGEAESSGEYHRDALPASFYMQVPFQRFQVGIFSARVAVVFYSLLGIVAFYWLLRQIAPLPLAVVATFLLGISVMDISASRLANVESHVKLWPILALALLALALQHGHWQIFGLSGLALAIGLLTYDTVLPMFVVLLIALVVELCVERVSWKDALQNLAAFLLPPLLTLPLLVPYFNSRMSYYKIEEKGWSEGWWSTLWENLVQVLQSWFVETRPDFIYNRPGPILNAVLLPLLFLGVLAALVTVRRRLSRWTLLWLFLLLIPVPVLTASPFGRVYYPGLPAIYALVALGGFVLTRELARLLKPNLVPLGVIVLIASVSWLPLYNFYLYFNAVSDPADRQIRREIGEFSLDAAQAGAHLYLPYWPTANDPLFVEVQIAELYLHQELETDQIAAAYNRVPLDDLLPHLSANADSWHVVDILIDTQTSTQRAAWEKLRSALFRCFPGGVLTKGHFFERYRLDEAALAEPVCTAVQLKVGRGEGEGENSGAVPWSLSTGAVDELHVVCEQEPESLIWVEAEEFAFGPGWDHDVAFVEGWRGSGYLVDSYGSQESTYQTELPQGESVYVWARTYKRSVDAAPAYLTLGEQQFAFADSEKNEHDEWVWERLGPFENLAPEQTWRIERPYPAPAQEFIALFIDSLVFTTDANFSPFDSSGRSVVYDQTHTFEASASQGYLHFNLPVGRYFCRVGFDHENNYTDAYGNPTIWSNTIEISTPSDN